MRLRGLATLILCAHTQQGARVEDVFNEATCHFLCATLLELADELLDETGGR
jgi:hypothetical protein